MDTEYMRMALDLAACARGRTSPNPMVGAVLVREGRVVGQGFHARAGLPHAEVEALRDAGAQARGATLYVTLEPCCHHGRTGPCTEAIIKAGVRRVVAAMRDPNPLVAGKGFARLRDAGIQVTEDVLKDDAACLNEVFVKFITRRRPFVVSKAAVSLDGKIATRTGDARWVTSVAARTMGHRLRDTYDAILVGIGTVLADDPSLTTRLPQEEGRDAVRIILDSGARTPVTSQVVQQKSPASTVIVVTAEAPEERRRALESSGVKVWVCGHGPRVDLDRLMVLLGEHSMTSVLVEGGAAVNAAFFTSGLVDKVVWFVAPKIVGGRDAPGPVGGAGAGWMSEAIELERVCWTAVGEDLCVEGYVKNTDVDG